MKIYILSCQECNGEYGTETHISAHSSLEKAKEAHLKVVEPEDIRIASIPEEPDREVPNYYNKWTHCPYKENTLRFHTGAWGYILWEIRILEVDA